jgi:cytochrome P450
MSTEASATRGEGAKAPLRQFPIQEGHWFWGVLLEMMRDRSGFLVRGHAKYGDTFGGHALGRSFMYTREPAVIHDINVTQWQSFQKPDYIKQMWAPFLGKGLVPNDGPDWKRQHDLIVPGFHFKRVNAYAPTMRAFTERLLAHWVPGEQRDFRADMLELALEIVCKTLFDIDVGAGDAGTIHASMVEISRLLVKDADKMIPRPRWWPTAENRRKQKAIADVEAIIWRILEERRRAQEDRGDLFSHMVFVRDEKGGMTDKQLRDEAMTLIFAGHETTAHALTWCWYLLAKHPRVTALLRDELVHVLGERPCEVDDLKQLPYLEKVIKESLRLLPSVWAYARQSTEDVVCGGYLVKKGTVVTISHCAMAFNESYYESPNEFRPERWTHEMEKRLPKGAYVPFAAGPRVCLGKQFAMMEMRLILATLLRRFEPNLAPGFEPDFVTELSHHPGDRGMLFVVTPVSLAQTGAATR